MITVRHHHGIELPGHDLWLDARHAKSRAFISHAHSDHVASHQETWASHATTQLLHARKHRAPCQPLHFHAPHELPCEYGALKLTLLPAGHIHGSAQCFVESCEGSLLYTGDFKLRPGLSCEPIAWCHAQTLVMETTFGLPRYCMPATDLVLEQIIAFCRQCLEQDTVPVLFGYSLGKTQEVLCALLREGLVPMLDPAAYRMTQIYSTQPGFPTGYLPFDASQAAGKVLICPPNAKRTNLLRDIPKYRTAILTGWALDPGAIYRYRVDAAFPLSDHADYPDLLRYVDLVRPKRILTLHGFAGPFARELRARGHEAWALTEENQLEFRF